MKGDIGFSSNQNHGSTFWFNFECGMNTLPVTSELDHLRLADKSILYYEPHSHSRATTYDILFNWHMKVTKVDTKAQLEEVLKQLAEDEDIHFDFALIGHDKTSTALSDLKKTITKIKPQIANIHLAINSNSPSLHDALLASGALSCLSKPITTNKLYSALLAEPEYLSTTDKNILPIKVLAVDDNEANLKLINALLLEQVSEVVLAENGLKAFELCQNEIFNLIFMDIQMPIMDGISSLQAIRRNSYNEKTPIIAVTAHALNGERERMEQQGFDAYMTKPIDETMLKHIIYEYCDINYFINNDKKRSHIPKEALSLTLKTELDIKIIDWNLALKRTGGKENLAKEMLTGLIESLPENKKNISIALEKKDSTQLKTLIHKLNGTCCYTGVPQLTNICQEIESQLKKEASVDSLEPEFLEFFEQIELVLEQAPSVLKSQIAV
jgi:two-component system sensor histidine kinase BarA